MREQKLTTLRLAIIEATNERPSDKQLLTLALALKDESPFDTAEDFIEAARDRARLLWPKRLALRAVPR